jgi:hypothetical protein
MFLFFLEKKNVLLPFFFREPKHDYLSLDTAVEDFGLDRTPDFSRTFR